MDEDPANKSGNSAASGEEDNSCCARDKIASFINHNFFQIFMTLVTIYALFGDDIRLLAFGKSSDNVFIVLNCIALALFSVEICL